MTYTAETFAPRDLASTNREWTAAEIAQHHLALLAAPAELDRFCKKRGLTVATVKRFQVGLYSPGVYMFPVWNDVGDRLLNVRYYAPGRPKDKWGVKGRSTKVLYPLLGLNGANPLWLCEGEFDAMMAVQQGLHAVTTCAGAPATPATLQREDAQNVFGPHRRFILAFDNDEAGRVATALIGLNVFSGRIDGIVCWPVGFEKDITDWFQQGHSLAELHALVRPWDDQWAANYLAAHELSQSAPSQPSLSFAARPQEHPGELADVEDVDYPEPEQVDAPLRDFDPTTMWPSTGFLHDYIDFAADFTDAPNQFHAGVSLTIFGASLLRRVGIQLGRKVLRTNFFTLLIAPSSTFRKTTCLDAGGDILYRYLPGCTLPREFSTESLVLHLAKQKSYGLLYYSEIAELLNQFERGYAQGVLALLTDFFDCPARYERETVTNGLQNINDVFISILAASTVDWVNKHISEEHVLGGFWPRFLFFPARRRTKPFLAYPPPPDLARRDALVATLRTFENVSGVGALSPEASAVYVPWSERLNATLENHRLGAGFGKHLSRMQVALLKIALLFELSESQQLVVGEEALRRAVALVDWLIAELTYLHEHEIAHNANEAQEQKLFRLVSDQPDGVTERDAMRFMRLSAKAFRGILESLEAKEYVVRASVAKPAGQRGPQKVKKLLTTAALKNLSQLVTPRK